MIISQMSRMLTLDEKRVASSATSSGPAGVCNVDEDWVIMYLGNEKRWDEMDYPYCRHSRTGSLSSPGGQRYDGSTNRQACHVQGPVALYTIPYNLP
jgi:hypothetical protein